MQKFIQHAIAMLLAALSTITLAQPTTKPTTASATQPTPRLDWEGRRLPIGGMQRLGSSRFALGETVMAANYSSDGKTILVRYPTCVITWDVASGNALLGFTEEAAAPSAAAFLGNDRIVTAWSDGKIDIHSAKDGEVIQKIKVKESGPIGLIASNDGGRLVVVVESDGTLWDTTSKELTLDQPLAKIGKTIQTATGMGNGRRPACQFSADGKTLVNVGVGNVIQLWDALAGRMIDATKIPPTAGGCASLSRNGSLLALCNNEVTIVEVATGKTVRTLAAESPAARVQTRISFSPTKDVLGIAGSLSQFWAWDITTDEATPVRLPSRAQGFEWAPDGTRIATAGTTTSPLFFIDVPAAAAPRPTTQHASSINLMAIAPDDSELVTIDAEGVWIRWDLNAGKPLQAVPRSQRNPVIQTLQYKPDGTQLLATTRLGRYVELDPKTLAVRKEVTADMFQEAVPPSAGGATPSRSFVTSDFTIAADSLTRAVRVWDVNTGKELLKAPNTQEMVGMMAFSPDNKRLLIAQDKSIVMYDLGNPQTPPRAFGEPGQNQTENLTWSPDQSVVLGAQRYALVAYDVETGTIKWRATGDGMYDAAIPEEQTFAAVLQPNGFLLVQLDDGQVVAQSLSQLERARKLDFLGDTRRLAVAMLNGTVVIYDLPTLLRRGEMRALSDDALWKLLISRDESAYSAGVELLDRSALVERARQGIASLPSNGPWYLAIEQLSDADAAVREKAHLALERGGTQAASAVAWALKQQSAGEGSQRLKAIARVIGAETAHPEPPPPSRKLITLRVLHLLHWQATDDAHAMIKELTASAEPTIAATAKRLLARPLKPLKQAAQ